MFVAFGLEETKLLCAVIRDGWYISSIQVHDTTDEYDTTMTFRVWKYDSNDKIIHKVVSIVP